MEGKADTSGPVRVFARSDMEHMSEDIHRGGAGFSDFPVASRWSTYKVSDEFGDSMTLDPMTVKDLHDEELRPRSSTSARSLLSSATGAKIVKLNVGGKAYATTMDTLFREESMLSVMIESGIQTTKDETGALFIDRDPTFFRYILNYLRDGDVDLPNDAVKLAQINREARYFQLMGLVRLVESRRRKLRRTPVPREVVLSLLHSSKRLELPSTILAGLDLSFLRFPAAHLTGSDLSAADLRFASLIRSQCRGASFKGANLNSADLTECELENVDFTAASLKKAQLYKANLRGSCFVRADLTRANLQEANMKGVSFQGSIVCKATLINADLRGFNLAGVNLEGANLEGAFLDGADLRGANLRGANLYNACLKGANVEGTVLRDANMNKADFSDVEGKYVR